MGCDVHRVVSTVDWILELCNVGWVCLWCAERVSGHGVYSLRLLRRLLTISLFRWLIAASGTIIGSTASFLVSRTLLRSYVNRLTSNDKRFAALALTLKHDGLKLLVMFRLCPLPYSLSNGAMSTIPTVTWHQFMLASTIASPKLILHVFVGSRLAAIAESGDKMDAKTKAISYLSIALGMIAGVATGYFMYTQTKSRANELEAEERDAAIRAGEGDGEYSEDGQYQYSDDPIERDAADALDRGDDDFSMHSARGDYRDEDSYSSGGEEADELERNPFKVGDGDEEQGFSDAPSSKR